MMTLWSSKKEILIKGYYGYLDYTNRQIKVYYSDNYTHDVTIENIQNYQSDYLKTITL